MFNLTNETDYKLLYKTKNYYNFFILTILFLFIAIFIRLIFLSLDNEKNNSQFNSRDTTLKVLPTIYDLNKKTLAYSSYNFSVKNIKNKVQYLNRDIPLNDILELIYEGDPYIKFEKILTRKYPYSSITNNLIGHTNIEHQGVSLIEKFVDKNRNDIELSLDIQIQKKIYDSLYNDTNNLNPDYAMNVLIDLSSEEIVSNVFIDNRDLNKFDQTLLPLKDLKYDFGSVFKTFTVYSAIKNQKIELNEYFDVDQPVYIGDKIINDYPRNSNIPMQVKDILKKSSNRGAILIRRNLDCQNEFKFDLDQIGLLKSTKIGFGLISVEPTVNNFKGRYCDNIPFGYGLSVTPIQLINAYGKIITGRYNFQATFEKQKKKNKNQYNQVSSTINKLLFYANKANDDLYNDFLVAGKTGTADQIISNGEKIQNVTYISFFPYNDPKYLNLTFMQNPKEKYGKYMTAGNTVKPSFFNILSEIYMYLDLSIINTKSTDI